MSPARLIFAFGLLAALPLVHLGRADEAVSPTAPEVVAADLRRHVEYLASEGLAGRETATEGARLAGDYIAAELKRFGCRPAGDDGGWFQHFAVPRPRLGKGNRLEVTTTDGTRSFAVEKEWNPFAVTSNGTAEGPLVFAGYGITAPRRNWDDYAEIDVKGKIVLVLRKDPGWNDTQHAAFVAKAANASRHGAVGILLCNNPATRGKGPDRIGHWSAPVGRLPEARRIPYAFVTQDVATCLLASLGQTLEELESALRSKGTMSRALGDVSVSLTTRLERSTDANARNVAGLLPGRDPGVADQILVVGAHYDHIGRGRFGSIGGPSARDKVHPGADDNASGVSALLEVAEYFAPEKRRPRRSLLFLALSGEELGLLGSSHYVAHPLFPLDHTVVMVNLDMVGRSREGSLRVGGVGTALGLRDLVARANEAHGLRVTWGEGGAAPSDSLPFFRKNIPVLFFFTGVHGDYHRPTDTSDKLNYPGLERVTGLVRDVAGQIAERAERLEFTAPPPPRRRPWIGIQPAQVEVERGVVVGSLVDGGPAAKAGLLAGDVIVALGEEPIRDMSDLFRVLTEVEAGKAIPIEVLRGGERQVLEIVPAKRRRR